MIESPFGKINIIINGLNSKYDFDVLPTTLIGNQGLPVFDVTQRYKISIETRNLPPKSIIKCMFLGDEFESSGIDTGERLALKTWEKQNIMLSIGTEDEQNDRYISYLETGIQIEFAEKFELNNVVFGLAWTIINNSEKEHNYTWYAADPTYAM